MDWISGPEVLTGGWWAARFDSAASQRVSFCSSCCFRSLRSCSCAWRLAVNWAGVGVVVGRIDRLDSWEARFPTLGEGPGRRLVLLGPAWF